MMKISYLREPTDLQCGQAVLAMICAKSVEEIVLLLNNDRETTLKEMKFVLNNFGYEVSDVRHQATNKNDLPNLCFLSLETPRCWHWSLYCDGVFYDPEHGIMDDFPECNRKYYWKVKNKNNN